MKRISGLFITVCFLGFLAAGLAATVLRQPETISYFENRALAVFPTCSAKSMGNGSYATQLENYLSDHAALRSTLLKLSVCTDLLLHRPVVNGIVVTSDALLPFRTPEGVDEKQLTVQADVMADGLEIGRASCRERV